MLILTFLAALGAAEDCWGIAAAAAAAKPGSAYQSLVDAEVAWFTAKVIDPHLATLPATERNLEQRRKILELAAAIRLAGSVGLPMPLRQAYLRARTYPPAKNVAGTDPVLAWTAFCLAQNGRLTPASRLRYNVACIEAWRLDPERWQARYPASLMIEAYLGRLEYSAASEAKGTETGAAYAQELAKFVELAWRQGEFTGRERQFLHLLHRAPVLKSGSERWIPRVLALVRDREDWFAHAVRGELALVRAGIARWPEVESQVPEEQKPAQQTQMQIARTEFAKAWDLDQRHPETAVGLLLSGVQDRRLTEAERWFTTAIRTEFDFEPAYTAMLTYLQPRWYGSYPQMIEFAIACADSRRFDTIVPSVCLEALALIRTEGVGDFAAQYGTEAWRQRIAAVIDGYARTLGPNSAWLARVRTDQVCYLWSLGDRDAALRKLQDLPKESVFWARATAWKLVRQEIEAALDAHQETRETQETKAPEF